MADIDTLRTLADDLMAGSKAILIDGTPSQVGPTVSELRKASKAILALLDENERLREALKPFADRCDEAVHPEDHDTSGLVVKVGHLRNARLFFRAHP